MPTARLRTSLASFRADVDASYQGYIREDGAFYFAREREQEIDILIPILAQQLVDALAASIRRTHLTDLDELVIELEWSAVRENGKGRLYASEHHITIFRHNPGETLRQLRKLAGLSQFQLAARAGITERSIRLIETGRTRSVRRETALRLGAALDVEMGDLNLPVIGSDDTH